MPYEINGNTVRKASTGKLVGHSSNPKAYLHVLQAVEHGWTPPKMRSNKEIKNKVKAKYDPTLHK
jgi:hypothetical protein